MITINNSNFSAHVRNTAIQLGLPKPTYGKDEKQWTAWFNKITKANIEKMLVDGNDPLYSGDLPKTNKWTKDEMVPVLAEAMFRFDLKEDPKKARNAAHDQMASELAELLKENASLKERIAADSSSSNSEVTMNDDGKRRRSD